MSRPLLFVLAGLACTLAARPSATPLRRPAEAGPAALLRREVLEVAVNAAQTGLERDLVLWTEITRWEDAHEVETAHWRVRTTQSRFLARSLAEDMETMLGHFQNVLGTDYAPPEPWPIEIYPDLRAYNEVGNAVGDEHSSFYGSFWADQQTGQPVVVLFDPDPVRLRRYVTHSAVHRYLAAIRRGPLPDWIEEGLASYFALYWRPETAARQLALLARSNRFRPLNDLLGTAMSQYGDDPVARLTELGMFFQYLLHYLEDTRMATATTPEGEASFADYLQGALAGAAVDDHPFQLLLDHGLVDLEAGFRACRFGQ